MSRAARALVRLLATLLVLAVVLVAADVGARRYALGRVAEQVQRELALPERPQVTAAGGSFLLQAARGRFDDVTVTVPRLPADDLELSDVRVAVPQVVVPRGVLLGGAGTVRLAPGTLRADLPFERLTARVAQEFPADLPVTLTRAGDAVRAGTRVSLLGLDLDLALDVQPRLVDGAVELVPVTASLGGREVPLSRARQVLARLGVDSLDGWTVPLDDVPGEVRLDALRVTDDGVVLDGRLLATSVPVR